MNPGMTAKIFLNYCTGNEAGFASLYISMRNVIIITTSFKETMETRNSLKKLQSREICWQNRKSDVEAEVSLGGLEEMEHICQLTYLIANNQLLKPVIEPVLTTALI